MCMNNYFLFCLFLFLLQGGIWEFIEEIFNGLINTLDQEEEMVKLWCKEDHGKEETDQFSTEKKEFCKAVIKIYMWMNGLNQNLRRVRDPKNMSDIELYLRCVIGNVSLVHLYKGHCLFEEFNEYISKSLGGYQENIGDINNSRVCENIEFSKVKLGGKLIGGIIEGWIDNLEKKGEKIRGYEWIMRNKECRTNNNDWRKVERGKNENKNDILKWFEGKDIEELQEVIKGKNYLSKEEAEDVVKGMKEKEILKEEKVKEELEKRVDQKIKGRNGSSPQPQATTSKPGPPEPTRAPHGPGIADKSNPKSGMSEDEKAFIEKLSEEKVEDSDISTFASTCEEERTGMSGLEAGATEKDKSFCRIMLRNFLMASPKDNIDMIIKGKGYLENIDPPVRCQILNLWMRHYKEEKKCDPEKMYEYIKKSIDATVGEVKWMNGSYQKCEYKVGNDSHVSTVDTYSASKEEQWEKHIREGIAKIGLGENCGETIHGSGKDQTTQGTGGGLGGSGSSSHAAGEAPPKPDSLPARHPPPPPPRRPETEVLAAAKARKTLPKVKEVNFMHSSLPYLPIIPVSIATFVTSYLLWKYFGMLGTRRKRYRRAYQVRGPSLKQQIVDHVNNQPDGPHEYILVKERKPRSTPIKRRKKRGADRRAGRPVRRPAGVRRRMIIDIHLEVLDECQKGDAKLVQEDFFEILVREFMECKFMKEENVPKEEVSKEQLPMVDVPKGEVHKEQVPSSDSGFREEGFVPEEQVPC
ncbi:SICA antigen [Plasmodium coatneyi]|uniref:SICA antigen n=1 Tax=Plasmodium coatneyi TaxID=208452 RepID=A0A1B1E642_9APIC|nr:SICA antigen [Plasmodium coatneyi]ANQ10502.1 SICA antigen [Plasmodium coatneyi]